MTLHFQEAFTRYYLYIRSFDIYRTGRWAFLLISARYLICDTRAWLCSSLSIGL
jgi:hypothetical protein